MPWDSISLCFRWTLPRELQDAVRVAATAAGCVHASPWVAAALRVALRREDEVLAELQNPEKDAS